MHTPRPVLSSCIILLLVCVSVGPAVAQEGEPGVSPAAVGTTFTYQGQLKDSGGNPVTATCNFQFGLWDAVSAGSQVAGTVTQTVPVSVTNGIFTALVDFGANGFDGNARWLGVAVTCPGDSSYIGLSPRQRLTPAPYAIYAGSTGALAGVPVAAAAPASGQVLKYNGAQWAPGADNTAHYQNVLVVAKSGGDYTSVSAALAAISTASQANPYLVKVMPGVYTEAVTMKPWVDIEGSGELTTKITSPGSASSSASTVAGASNAELRFLTVENTGGAPYATAIRNSGNSPRLSHVTVAASGGSSYTYGLFNDGVSMIMTNVSVNVSGAGGNNYGVDTNNSSMTMTDVSVTVAGGAQTYNYGASNSGPSLTMTNMTVAVSGDWQSINCGISNGGGSVAMMNVSAAASGAASHTNVGVENSNSSPTLTNVNVSVWGGSSGNTGVYNSNGSPKMMGVTAVVTGTSTTNYGVWNYNASPTMMNISASASGASSTNYGVRNESGSAPTLTNATLAASGGSGNYGLWNDSSSATIKNSVISASDGTSDGMHSVASSGSYTVLINNSQISAGTSTIYQDSHYTTRVGGSEIAGGGAFGGTYQCVVSYNGSYQQLNATCGYP